MGLAGVFLLIASAASAEERPLAPGTFCRVTAPTVASTSLIGTLVEKNERELVLVAPKTGLKAIPIDAITKLEWSPGLRTRARAYGLGGALLGFTAGAIGGATSGGDCRGVEGSCAMLGGFVGALAWGAVGAVVGLTVRSHQWREVKPDRARLSLAPLSVRGSGAGLSLSVSW